MAGQNIDTLLDDPWSFIPPPETGPPAPNVIIPTIGQNIDTLFDDEWFGGQATASTSLVPGLYQVAIAGHGYVIDPTAYDRVTVPLRRESTDESVEPGEQTLNTGGAWKRAQDDWFMGAGQEYLDNRFAFVSVYVHSGEDPSIRTRFWRSKGVDPFVFGALSLLPEYGLGFACTNTILCTVGTANKVFVAATVEGAQVLIAADNNGFTTTISPPGGSWPTIHSMDTDGFNLYVACGDSGIAKVESGSSTSTWLRGTSPTPTVVVNGTPGSMTYHYYVVAKDSAGYTLNVSAVATVTNGNATLTGSNYNEVTWTAVEGAVSYDVLRGDTTHSIATDVDTTSYSDIGGSTVSYTQPGWIDATFVGYANSFLLAGSGPNLVTVGADGTITEVFTHFNPSFTWTCSTGAPGNIYVAGTGGGTSELYGVQLSTTTFALGAPYIAGQVSDGELINDLTYYEGMVILATSLGVRAGQTTDQTGYLTTGSVITDLGGSECLSVYGSFVWFGVSDFDENDGIWTGTGVTSGLGRLFLSEFSSPLLPAYASDRMSTVEGTCTSVANLDGVPWFAIEGSGVWIPTGNVVPYGFLESGWVRYGTTEDKILVSSDVRHDPLAGTVSVEVVPFGSDSYQALSNDEQGSTSTPSLVSAGNAVGEAFHIIPYLQRSASNPKVGPVLRRWECRAMIVAVRQDQIVVPIIWADEVVNASGDGAPLSMDLVAEWQFLKSLEASGAAFSYQEGALSYTAFIDQIELKADKWNDQRRMLEGVCEVKLLTVN